MAKNRPRKKLLGPFLTLTKPTTRSPRKSCSGPTRQYKAVKVAAASPTRPPSHRRSPPRGGDRSTPQANQYPSAVGREHTTSTLTVLVRLPWVITVSRWGVTWSWAPRVMTNNPSVVRVVNRRFHIGLALSLRIYWFEGRSTARGLAVPPQPRNRCAPEPAWRIYSRCLSRVGASSDFEGNDRSRRIRRCSGHGHGDASVAGNCRQRCLLGIGKQIRPENLWSLAMRNLAEPTFARSR